MKYLYILATLFFFISCNESEVEYDDPKCTISKQNEFVYNYMQKNYLWSERLPSLDYAKYSSPAALLEDLKVPEDRWSFIMPKEALEAYYNGLGYVGLGFKIKYLDGKLYIALVYPNSPAGRANLKRGDRILSINGEDVDNKDYTFVNRALGNDQEGVRVDITIEDEQKNVRSITLYKEQVHTPSVLKTKIFTKDESVIGYILFDAFITPSSDELKDAFEQFKQAGVEKIIVDLRYNGGGLVEVANDFISLLIGKEYHDGVSFKLFFNENNSYKNRNYYIKYPQNAMAVNDIYFLTTQRTCSASEALINALKPYGVDIHIIGSQTCGKPVGMVGDDFCDFYVMPIEFKIANANSESDYFNGLSVTCSAQDDVAHDFADEEEAMFAEALYLMKNGVCSSTQNARVVKPLGKELILDGFEQFNGGAF